MTIKLPEQLIISTESAKICMLECTASLGDFLSDLWIVKTMKYDFIHLFCTLSRPEGHCIP